MQKSLATYSKYAYSVKGSASQIVGSALQRGGDSMLDRARMTPRNRSFVDNGLIYSDLGTQNVLSFHREPCKNK